MADPFLGEIRLVGFNFAPTGWHICDGSLLNISAYSALFALIGTFYGGDGTTNFALPDLRGRTPIHYGADGFGNTYVIGQQAGAETVTLTQSTMPGHHHPLQGTTAAGDVASPNGRVLAQPASSHTLLYAAPSNPTVALNPASVQPTGGGQPHDNLQPFLVLNYCIALQGAFPPRS
jgi:microcystin-dependent protein